MRRATLARELIDAPGQAARRKLLSQFHHLADEKLAGELRKACYAAWTVEPVRAQRAAAAARLVAATNPSTIIAATAAWLQGIAAITKGKFEAAVVSLDEAAATLTSKSDAAEVQVARLLALAMLSRYDEAIAAGNKALRVLSATGDGLGAGKIELNLSNIAARQGRYREAEKYGLSALRRFTKTGEEKWRAMAENSLANTYADINDFAKAEKFYRRALETAHRQKMAVTEAETEASLGNLAAFRGRYADALRYLESSRQRYDELAMPHQSAIADLEMADIYLELNLLAEAVEIYSRVGPVFRRLKMRAEESRAHLESGRARVRLADLRTAKRELAVALKLFAAEKNLTAQASVLLSQAECALAAKDPHEALEILKRASDAVMQNGTVRQRIYAALFAGEAFLAAGKPDLANERLARAAYTAKKIEQPDALSAAYGALGKLAVSRGDFRQAKQLFSRSIEVIERLRSPLGADEFGMAFFGSRRGPYELLAKVQIESGMIADAFSTIERGRSRALLDAIRDRGRNARVPRKLADRSGELRAELNARYKALEVAGDDAERLRQQIGQTEKELVKINRQVRSLTLGDVHDGRTKWAFKLEGIRSSLADATLVEFVEFSGNISAFVVGKNKTRYFDGLTTTTEVGSLLDELHFQLGSLRYGGAMAKFAGQLKARTDVVLEKLYDRLIKPLEDELKTEELVIVPVGALHYVPFAALRAGDKYLAQRFEITSAPSAAVWCELQGLKRGKISSSLLMGHADERIPLVENEVRELSEIVPKPVVFTGEDATFPVFSTEAGRHDLVHLACHGQFRPDNPMFSSLHLADGWITVQDLTAQRLRAKLVTLSACETGLSKVFAGDELLGLVRGFLAAGAASMIVSLWTVNDEAASKLMQRFYLSLQRGCGPAASLRDAQIELITAGAHPFLWSPFICIGR